MYVNISNPVTVTHPPSTYLWPKCLLRHPTLLLKAVATNVPAVDNGYLTS